MNQHKEAQLNAVQTSHPDIPQDTFPLTGANTIPLPIRPQKDSKGYNKFSKGKGLLPPNNPFSLLQYV